MQKYRINSQNEKWKYTNDPWLAYAKEPEKRLRFQNFIFEENLPFTGEKFGTAKLTPIYSIYQDYLRDPTSLVSVRQIEPRDSLPHKVN